MPQLAFNLDPVIGVLPHKYVTGMKSPADDTSVLGLMEFYKLSDAMTHLWPGDNHFVTYTVIDTNGQPVASPRLNKPLLSHVRQSGWEIVATCLAFDFDTPDHQPWAPGEFDRWLLHLQRIGEQWPQALQFQYLYATRSGARLVYVLNEPLPVDVSETKHRGMVQMFVGLGLPTDPLSDWTRLFRSPNVHRDGLPTTQEPNHLILNNPGMIVDHTLLPESGAATNEVYDTIHEVQDPKPGVEEAKALLEGIGDTGYRRKSAWYKAAKRRLMNRDSYPCLFNNQPMATRGNRNNSIHSYVGQATALLVSIPNTTPQHIYALFLDPVLQFEPEPDTPDWTNVLWDHACRLWSKEDAKLRAKLREVEPDQERAMTIAGQMVNGMREWNDHPYLYGDDVDKAMSFILRHSIVSVGRYLFLMQSNGYYSANALAKDQLVAEIMCRNMTDIMPVRKMNPSTNAVVKVSAQDLQDQYSVAAGTSIEYRPNIVGGYLKNLGKLNRFPKLVLPCFRINTEITPRFDPDVDQWLRIMFGVEYDTFERWAKWALAYTEGAIAAISIVGNPGSGKKLIAEGLAECLEDPQLANAEDIVSGWSYGLLRSPFVVVDEGWPEVSTQIAANAFRHLIDDRIYVNEKYKPPAEVMNKPRIVMTANNLNIIKTLTGKGSMSVSDREALSQRLLHFNVGGKAARWLKDKGGMGHTGQPGRRWIADASGNSDFVLARHLLYLYSLRGPIPHSRYLVEGNGKHEVIFSMQTETGSTPIVIECLIRMLNSQQKMTGLIIDGNRLYVLACEIVEFFRLNLSSTTKERVSANIVAAALKSLTLTEDFHSQSRTMPQRPGFKRHWHDLDCRLLRKVAERIGNECATLDALADGQEWEFGNLDPDATSDSNANNARVLS